MDRKNEQQAKTLLNVIDQRINKFLEQSKTLQQYSGIVTRVVDNTHAEVRIAGEKTSFLFLNLTLMQLSVGDSVYIKTIGTDMSTGVITQKFINKREENIRYDLFPVGSVITTTNLDPNAVYTGVWNNFYTTNLATKEVLYWERTK